MNDKLKAFFTKVKNPTLAVKIIAHLFTTLVCVGAIIVATMGFSLSIFAYVLYALAALSLTYSVYLIVLVAPKIKRDISKIIYRFEFTKTLVNNYGYRTIAFSLLSFVMSVAFGVFNAYMGIKFRSIWYGALATYYIFLVLLRGGVLLYHKNKAEKTGNNKRALAISQARVYRNCGIILLVLNVALSSAITQMIFDDRFFIYLGWTIYAFAAYAFYKIIMSIINIVKANKHDDLTVQAIRNVNLADATVSILALQTALLHTFVSGETDISLFNTITGIAVTLVTISISIIMLIKANKVLTKLQSEKNNGKQI